MEGQSARAGRCRRTLRRYHSASTVATRTSGSGRRIRTASPVEVYLRDESVRGGHASDAREVGVREGDDPRGRVGHDAPAKAENLEDDRESRVGWDERLVDGV